MTSPTDGDCRCVWGRDEDGLPECQNGDCRCPQHCVDEDTGLPIGEAVTGEIQAWAPIEVVERLTAERDALRASVQRVERLLDRCDQDTYDFYGGEGSPVVLTQYVRDALDGGESDE